MYYPIENDGNIENLDGKDLHDLTKKNPQASNQAFKQVLDIF